MSALTQVTSYISAALSADSPVIFNRTYKAIQHLAEDAFRKTEKATPCVKQRKIQVLTIVMTTSSLICLASAATFFVALSLNAFPLWTASLVCAAVCYFFSLFLERKIMTLEEKKTLEIQTDWGQQAEMAIRQKDGKSAISALSQGAKFQIKNGSSAPIDLIKEAIIYDLPEVVFYLFMLDEEAFFKTMGEIQPDSSIWRHELSEKMEALLYDLMGYLDQRKGSHLRPFILVHALCSLNVQRVKVFLQRGCSLNEKVLGGPNSEGDSARLMTPLELFVVSLTGLAELNQKRLDEMLDLLLPPNQGELNSSRGMQQDRLLYATPSLALDDEYLQLLKEYLAARAPSAQDGEKIW